MTKTHGKTGTKVHRTWKDMKRRCNNPKRDDYKHYGGRGIKVCERWQEFENFYSDMGDPPEGYTLERCRVNEDYSLDNCKWATINEQRRNTRKTTWLIVNGKKVSLPDAANLLGLNINTLYMRIKRGWSPKKAVSVPLIKFHTARI